MELWKVYAVCGNTFIGLILGNFAWQLIKKGDYRQTIERSFFQAIAIGFVILNVYCSTR